MLKVVTCPVVHCKIIWWMQHSKFGDSNAKIEKTAATYFNALLVGIKRPKYFCREMGKFGPFSDFLSFGANQRLPALIFVGKRQRLKRDLGEVLTAPWPPLAGAWYKYRGDYRFHFPRIKNLSPDKRKATAQPGYWHGGAFAWPSGKRELSELPRAVIGRTLAPSGNVGPEAEKKARICERDLKSLQMTSCDKWVPLLGNNNSIVYVHTHRTEATWVRTLMAV